MLLAEVRGFKWLLFPRMSFPENEYWLWTKAILLQLVTDGDIDYRYKQKVKPHNNNNWMGTNKVLPRKIYFPI